MEMIENLTNKLNESGWNNEQSSDFTTKRTAFVVYYPDHGYMTGKKARSNNWSLQLQKARLFGRRSDASQAIPSNLKGKAGVLVLNCSV